uniref:F-box domain-containing protein n=1 Tax=Strongyloides papillosus TaxID=174720 RepID=A0A0N5B5D3_STREA
MDLSNSIMDFNIEDEYFDVEDDTSVLPDDVLVIIFKELSLEDIKVVKQVSKRFYGIVHRNYHKLNRRKVLSAKIEYDERCDNHPFLVHMNFYSENSSDYLFEEIKLFYEKSTKIQSVDELTGFLRMFDLRKLDLLILPVADNLDLFGIMEGVLEIGTKVNDLVIKKLAENDFGSFRTFIEKLSRLEVLCIYHLCAPSTGQKDVFSLLSLTSFNTIYCLMIFECNKTKILASDFVVKFIRNSPSLMAIDIGSYNIEFLWSLSKEYFTMEQPRQMENECSHNKIHLNLIVYSEIERLYNNLTNDFGELECVVEEEMISFNLNRENIPLYIFGSKSDCSNCLKNRHRIKKYVAIYYFMKDKDDDEEWNH